MTGRSPAYHPFFESDLKEIVAWYDNRVYGLGEEFVAAVHEAIESVLFDPERFAVLDEDVRQIRLGRFPYIMPFEVDEDYVVFFGVVHTSRSMERWKRGRMS